MWLPLHIYIGYVVRLYSSLATFHTIGFLTVLLSYPNYSPEIQLVQPAVPHYL